MNYYPSLMLYVLEIHLEEEDDEMRRVLKRTALKSDELTKKQKKENKEN